MFDSIESEAKPLPQILHVSKPINMHPIILVDASPARLAATGATREEEVNDYGLRMKDHDRRVSAKQLRTGEQTIHQRLRGERYKLYKRVSANIGVYTKGSDVRMGKGKGKFDYWAARIPVSRIIFELKGNIHEAVVRDAFRLAGNKLPGMYEFVKKGDPPVVGITKLGNGVTLESLKAAKRPVEPKDKVPGQSVTPPMMDVPPQSVSTDMDQPPTTVHVSP
ncbi:39S ribosomal protein L16, mitochondrial [Exophiala xenobiotica]|uniref:39S ribosomal protein L16, mitochondrial n=1 Tax=Vermiconidia calcicola TaxID=1690605 RepID=A0AAV9QKL8_9PEZI|nr:39S ribosomal protein L16, mitochondrial [Exophiala xenobiotica]KAK5545153.1 39S ribosomal protein L16, mitochondrial [Vermiconidia calcicola]KAK5549201.1 39S ribosomal protein L16, mitochondrial [Chaetothyriales sp. CCFEE 6169]KAK5192218.1 39S ribosomal protein L16, mitochondrial [Exophiala xenobiotica]KAK5207955.1 39S ribosomal protein L16, mitochondrial [Exophiala xenobiotica]